MSILTFILLFIIGNLCAYIFSMRDAVKMYQALWQATADLNAKLHDFIKTELNREQEWRNSLDD